MADSSEKSTQGWVLALTSVASFMVALDSLVVTSALSVLRDELGASIEALEWTVNAFNLSFAVLLLTGAALGDRFGRRRLFAGGLALFVVASAGCALVPDAGWLIAARALQGMGAALVMPLGMALLGVAFSKESRGKALGIFSSVVGLALITGPVVGGVVAEGISWQWIFWINIPIGIVVLPLILRRIPESLGPPTSLDVPGLVLVTGAAFGLVWALMRGTAAGWASGEVLAAFAAGLVLAAAFVAWERRAPAPMVPLRFFGIASFSSTITASFLFYAAMYGTLFLLPQFLQVGQGHGPLGSGLRLLPWTATLFVFGPIGGSLINRLGERTIIVAGLIVQAIGMAWIGLVAAPDLAYLQLVPALVLAGAGVSLAMPAAQNAVLGSVAPNEIGKASGTFNMFRYFGAAFGVAVLAAVFGGWGSVSSATTFSAGFTPAMLLASALSLAGAAIATTLPGRSTGPQPAATSPTTRTRTRTELPGK